ncbi:hypothetical protein EVAR_58571_1 [Eumeta japonica]|uniref:Uncharacterized protein n=1 Tax=Eumeta variegata TaxID=151549 RepID=A0A4C1Z4S6_EUMVA|nr:hypothetical protein EVAR_58571_1 [Eumeta japonica]
MKSIKCTLNLKTNQRKIPSAECRGPKALWSSGTSDHVERDGSSSLISHKNFMRRHISVPIKGQLKPNTTKQCPILHVDLIVPIKPATCLFCIIRGKVNTFFQSLRFEPSADKSFNLPVCWISFYETAGDRGAAARAASVLPNPDHGTSYLVFGHYLLRRRLAAIAPAAAANTDPALAARRPTLKGGDGGGKRSLSCLPHKHTHGDTDAHPRFIRRSTSVLSPKGSVRDRDTSAEGGARAETAAPAAAARPPRRPDTPRPLPEREPGCQLGLSRLVSLDLKWQGASTTRYTILIKTSEINPLLTEGIWTSRRNDAMVFCCGRAMLWPIWLQHKDSRPDKYKTLTKYRRDIAASAFGFRQVSKSSGGSLPLRQFTPFSIRYSPKTRATFW